MPGPAVEILKRFGAVEDDQKYTRLVDLFTDDAIYYDPFFGPQRGKGEIQTFMEHMERLVPASGARFDDWHVEGDTVCGWATWTMLVRGDEGDVSINGQSLYRLRGDKVCFVADYVDPVAYSNLRAGKLPDLASAGGISSHLAPEPTVPARYPARDLVKNFWAIQDEGDYTKLSPLFAEDAVFKDLVYGTMTGGKAITDFMILMKTEMPARGVTFELVDCAGDTNVAWSQWNCHFPNGTVPGWTLHTVRDGKFTLDADYFDTAASKALRTKA